MTPIAFSTPDLSEGDVAAVVKVLDSGWLTTGEECARLESDLAAYLGANHVVALSSCTAALETVFAALALPPGARVGVPTWTFAASALAPMRYGARPVLLDVDPYSLTLSPAALAAELEEGLDAVVVVHFGGVPVEESIYDLCAEAGVPVVEDAAHALGAVDRRGRIAGKATVAACFSFYATKNLTSGEGGALATDSPELADFARTYRLHGLTRDAADRHRRGAAYDLLGPGIKANLPDLLAALARSQLSRYDEMQATRRELVVQYRETLGTVPGVRVVPAHLVSGSADHLMVVELPDDADREQVIRRLSEQGIGSSVHFRPLHTFSWLRDHASVGRTGTACADALSSRVMSLPLHSGMQPHQVEVVGDALWKALFT